MLVTEQLMDPIDFHTMEVNGAHILQKYIFCV